MSEVFAPLFERDAELGAIASALEQLSEGFSSILVIEGQAGIGKSALLAAMVVAAGAAGLRVVRGAARDIDRHRPFAAFADLAGIGQAQPVALFAALASGGPAVVAVDNLQWADPASLGLLERLVAVSRHQPLAILVTLRPQPQSLALQGLLASARTHGAEVLQPRPLSPAGGAALAERAAGMPIGRHLREALTQLGGNPMAVEQVVRGLLNDDALAPDRTGALEQSTSEPIPTPRASMRQALRALSPRTFDLLGLVAILGSSCRPDDLRLMTNRSPADLREGLAEATAAGVLAAVVDQVAFRHDVIHEALYDDLPLAVRRALHADAASVLEAAQASPAVVAEHAIRAAGDDGATVGRLRRAAAAAVALGAMTVALDLIAAALASGAVDEASHRQLAAELPSEPALPVHEGHDERHRPIPSSGSAGDERDGRAERAG